ncbi:MAG TPA: polysaccharide deacetylase family protein [Thermodesulfobacteriota bacterium]
MYIDPLTRRLLRGAGAVPSSEGRGPVLLMYHSISSDAGRWAVTEKSFREHIAILVSEGWTTVCVRDLKLIDLPARAVALTFDDGYDDNFRGAFLPLAEAGMRATWFIVSGAIGKGANWDQGPGRRMLDGKQLREMESCRMEIGSHTRSHPRLTETGAGEIEEEISGSKKDLEDVLGSPVGSFAYPYGLHDEASVAAVRAAGYTAACTTRTGWYGSEKDQLRLRRVAVFPDDSPSAFARKLVFADNRVDWPTTARYMASRVRARLGFAG